MYAFNTGLGHQLFHRARASKGRLRRTNMSLDSKVAGVGERIAELDSRERGWHQALKAIAEKEIQGLSESQFATALSMEGKERNRYTDVLANENTRVKIPQNNPSPGGDYINANFLEGFHGPKQYIATQAPLKTTIEDFYDMIWLEDVTTIVMLAQFIEDKVPKADRYWPKSTDVPATFGKYRVEVARFRETNFGTVRSIRISMGKATRTIEHAHFLKWPDHGVPKDSRPVLELVQYMNERQRNSSSPLVVHCSAGLGRTGTLVAIHILMQRISSGQTLTVEAIDETVLRLKKQRHGLVQSGEQLRLIYKVMND